MTREQQHQRRGCRAAQNLCRDRRGSTAVEFALVAPVLVYALLAAADLGLALSKKAQVANAVRAGAEYASVNGWNSSKITTAAKAATVLNLTVTPTTYCGCASANAVTQQTCGTACASGGTTGTYVSVAAQASYTPISPVNWAGNVINLNATMVTRIN